MRSHRPSLFEHARADLPAGLVVFLVAVPLCLGIAQASGAPPFAGLLTGIIGGIVVGFLSGSPLSVSGPAAGLTVLVLSAITELGYPAFLLAVVLAGALQISMGLLRSGVIAHFFPGSVIKGMLAAIGIILILRWLTNIREVYHRNYDEIQRLPTQEERENRLVELNTEAQLENLTKSSIIQTAWHKHERPYLHAWAYGLHNGVLKTLKTIAPNSEVSPAFRLD